MAYQYVQLVAYEAPTKALMGMLPKPSEPWDQPGWRTKWTELLRKLGDGKEHDKEENYDAQNRIHRFLSVLNWAVESIPHDQIDRPAVSHPLQQSKTLKVFMAPEFYFRPTDTGYSRDTLFNILECLKLCTHDDWRLNDWLIVPGTICSHQVPQPNSAYANEGKPTFLNTACIIEGGINGGMTYVHKLGKSDQDRVPISDATEDPNFKYLLGSWEEQKKRLFTFGGITFGLEVCLDHEKRALKETLINWRKKEHNDAPPVDVHLITSCGLDIRQENYAARVGGCVLWCDGLGDGTPSEPHSAAIELEVLDPEKVRNPFETLPLVDPTFKVEPRKLSERSRGKVPNQFHIEGHESTKYWFAPEVVVYEPVELFKENQV